MWVFEGIFYTNLDIDVSAFIVEIKQKETIDKYTIFVIFGDHRLTYKKYWKHHDCSVLRLKNDIFPEFSNNKYSNYYMVAEYEKYFDLWDLLDKYVKFKRNNPSIYYTSKCNLSNDLIFLVNICSINYSPLVFNNKHYTTKEFITEIQENYPEFYKHDYSQIKPAIKILAKK